METKTPVDHRNRLIQKQDCKYLAILITLALVLGVYLIITTVLISKDGVFFIERAQQLASDPVNVIKAHSPGYPFLILAAHKCAALFTDDSSVFTWIYAAQSITLLCRLLALIPLYFMGKLLVGSKNSFWAILILIFLPYPTSIGCDVVREWPYLLFLASGFFFLLWSAKSGKWWLFGLVGLFSGLGFLIRTESAQLIIYSLLWGGVSLFKPGLWGVHRCKNFIAIALLLICFAIPAVPYISCSDNIIREQIWHFTRFLSSNTSPCETDIPKADTEISSYDKAGLIPTKLPEALGKTFTKTGESLMWFFMPAMMIGLYYRFRGDAQYEEKFLITTFILVSLTMIVLRYNYIQLPVSQRWCLPFVTFTIFYIPVGLQIIGNWLNKKPSPSKQKADISKDNRLSWFAVLFLIGIGICLPKLLRPIGREKHGYREVAKWLKQNTGLEDVIAVPDKRIIFYAERKGSVYSTALPEQVNYAVSIMKDGDEKPEFGIEVQEKKSVLINRRDKNKRIIIYEVL